ncbi:MAG TPA: glycosyltransferase [Candidatus Saccharimonadia bacterium]|jgi:glycosyltransferase involved in cell wall biosynthesis
MRIGLFTDRYVPQIDGVSISTESFRQELEKLGHEVYVFAPRPSWRYKERSSRIIRFPAVKGLFWEDNLSSLFFPPQISRQIDKLNLDIIHFQTPGQIGLFGAYYAIHNHIPLATTYHTDLYEYVKHYRATLPGTIALSFLVPAITGGGMSDYRKALSSITPERNIDRWNQKILVRMITMIHNRCDLVIAPSEKTKQQLLSWHTTSRVEVMPTGVDEITTKNREISHVRKLFDLSPDDQPIIFVGRIGTEKNVSLLIRAFATIGRQNRHAKLVIVGQGDDIDSFKRQAAATPYPDRIIFTGFIDHQKLGAILKVASVFGFPSLTDTQGMVINEAARAGLPIVMVDHGISQVVIDGQNGYFARNSARDFAAKVLKILANPELHQRMSKRSIELSAEVTPGKQAAKLLRLYQESIEQHRESTNQVEPSHPQL